MLVYKMEGDKLKTIFLQREVKIINKSNHPLPHYETIASAEWT